MIAVDTSALVAIVMDEPEADRCQAALSTGGRLLMSAGTLTEVLIVAARRGASSDMDVLLNGLPLEVLPVTGETARRAAAAYDSWGKGVHPAGLNLGDCFAYAIAREHECALLYVGNDFALTDITAA
ncbi:type II toxin-antitoxin system VapC family toxin [Caulobacter sp. NIBR1757]|uniref:type II toxin-antitoxin system VapC family toxin n=1 Tax=Caulobacter sp. NIBR1757 TaxID=3016000 RepID=UPI0022F0334C|nr:type II toxin-antitoxin system VapC family toxin [Caulobacter sp. NIBR1757]